MSGLARMLAARLAAALAILLGLTVIVFALETVIPADPVRALLGPSAGADALSAQRHQLWLDRPLPVQYLHFLGNAIRGNLSVSLTTRRPVVHDLAAFLPATLELAACAVVLATVLGTAFGLLTARRRSTAIRLGFIAWASVPQFLLGLASLVLFYGRLHWFPGSGRLSPGITPPSGPTGLLTLDSLAHGDWTALRDSAWHLVLPSLCLAVAPAVSIGRTLRSSLQSVLSEDYILTARAKGLSHRQILLRHAFRNALTAPLATLGLQAGLLFAGVVVVESIFAWPGLGLYTSRAIQGVDFPAIAGVTLVLGTAYVVINLVVDLLQLAADPRLRKRVARSVGRVRTPAQPSAAAVGRQA
jgi:peptide/nickel transport system permease protein